MTLQLHARQTIRSALRILLVVALIAGGVEAGARLLLDETDALTAIGSDNPTFNIKIGMLDRLARESGGVDCIFLGSSVVQHGIDPAVFEIAYQAETGAPITCYNFGIPALTGQTAGVVAELLVDRYRPRLLVYGFTLRALAEGTSQARRVYNDITGSPWVRYRQGSFTLTGWLIDHSSALRHYLPYRNWMRHDFPTEKHFNEHALPTGYEAFISTRALDLDAITVPDFFASYAESPAQRAGLDAILALDSDDPGGTRVLLLEMPLPDFFLAHFEGGKAGYLAEFDALANQAAARGVVLWITSPLDPIPFEGWAEDAQHTNPSGAEIFSAWLGEQIGQAANAGTLAQF